MQTQPNIDEVHAIISKTEASLLIELRKIPFGIVEIHIVAGKPSRIVTKESKRIMPDGQMTQEIEKEK